MGNRRSKSDELTIVLAVQLAVLIALVIWAYAKTPNLVTAILTSEPVRNALSEALADAISEIAAKIVIEAAAELALDVLPYVYYIDLLIL